MQDARPTRPSAKFAQHLEQQLRHEAMRQQPYRHGKLYHWITRGSTLAACVALLLFLLIPHNTDTFAAMQETVMQSDNMAAQIRMEMVMGEMNLSLPISITQSWMSRRQGIRSDVSFMGQQMVQLWHPWEGDCLLIDHLHRMTIPIQMPKEIDARELLRFDPSMLIYRITQWAGKPQTIDSNNSLLQGYRLDCTVLQLPNNANVEVWVNRKTLLPSRIVCQIPLDNGSRLDWIADHFAWTASAVPARLKPIIPSSYAQKEPLQIPTPNLDAVARSLKNYAWLTKGSFPGKQTLPWQGAIHVFTQSVQDPNLLKERTFTKQQLVDLADALSGGIFILRALEQGADITYQGENMRLGDDRNLLTIQYPDGKRQTINGKLESQVNP